MPKQIIDSFKGEYAFLSNFYHLSTPIIYMAEVYPTVEHAYQAAKSPTAEGRKAIRLASSPGMAKKFGRVIPVRKDWEEVKLFIMKSLLDQKFRSDISLLEKLLATGDAELIEGNWWGDEFWGVCRDKGLNHLGKLLMEVRKELRNEHIGDYRTQAKLEDTIHKNIKEAF